MIHAPSATPVSVSITAPNVNDITAGKRIRLEAGATYVFDKAYCDYHWWRQFTETGAVFVTRLKTNARVRVTHTRAIAADAKDAILADETIVLAGNHRRAGDVLRRVTVARTDNTAPIVIVTNDFTRPAAVIADLYRQRWAIELFFKWIKQHLKIKQFLGRSENAVKTQIDCALIAYLLLRLYACRHGMQNNMWMCLAAIRGGLFLRPKTEAAMASKEQAQRAQWAARQPGLWGEERLGQ